MAEQLGGSIAFVALPRIVRGDASQAAPPREMARYGVMYLSSTILESGRKIGGKTSSLHFGL